VIERASKVLLEDCPVVWLLAYKPSVCTDCAGTVTVAVTVFPFIPKLTLFEFENTMVPELAESPAAEMAPTFPVAVAPAGIEAVMALPAEVPKLTLFALLKLSVWNSKLPFCPLAA
jgi:hypothetical protein